MNFKLLFFASYERKKKKLPYRRFFVVVVVVVYLQSSVFGLAFPSILNYMQLWFTFSVPDVQCKLLLLTFRITFDSSQTVLFFHHSSRFFSLFRSLLFPWHVVYFLAFCMCTQFELFYSEKRRKKCLTKNEK